MSKIVVHHNTKPLPPVRSNEAKQVFRCAPAALARAVNWARGACVCMCVCNNYFAADSAGGPPADLTCAPVPRTPSGLRPRQDNSVLSS